MSKVKDSNEANFSSEVLMSPGSVLVDFWAPWCGPCKALAPKLEEIANEGQTEARIVKVNVDENPSLAASYGVRGLPTMVLIKEGEEIERLMGNQSKDAILEFLNRTR